LWLANTALFISPFKTTLTYVTAICGLTFILPLIVVRQSLAVTLATASYFGNLLADIYLFTPKMGKVDMMTLDRPMIDSGRAR